MRRVQLFELRNGDFEQIAVNRLRGQKGAECERNQEQAVGTHSPNCRAGKHCTGRLKVEERRRAGFIAIGGPQGLAGLSPGRQPEACPTWDKL
jgi:hypothetical protein